MSIFSCHVISFVCCRFVLLISLVPRRSVTLRKSWLSVLSGPLVSNCTRLFYMLLLSR